jgi:hypothetical protein
MGLRYNPFNGSFDFTRSPGSYLDGEVQTFADLPLDTAAAPLNSAWLVREASGLYFLTRKPAGIYIRTATGGIDRSADFTYASAFPDVFSDANLVVYSDADSSKNIKFSAGSITTGQTRTLTVPDKSGTIATTDASDLTSGTLADARLSSNVPLKDAANTFSSNQTLNGTNNVAPNQTAASGSSVMTRGLVNTERLLALHSVRILGAYAFGASGAGSTAVENYVRGGTSVNSGTAAAGYGRASVYRGVNRPVGFTGGGINFAQKISVSVLFASSFNTADTVQRIIVGGNGGAPAASDADALSVQGFGLEISRGSGTNLRARLFCRNATTYATSAYTADFVGSVSYQIQAVLTSDGAGAVELLLSVSDADKAPSRPSTTPSLTLSGGPTAAGGAFIDIVSVNPAGATVASSSDLIFWGGWLQIT